MSSDNSENHSYRRERSNRFFLLLIVWIAKHLGRRFTRGLLVFIVFYFVSTAPSSTAASRDFLRRVLGKKPRWRDVFRHFYSFASTILDRVYVLGGDTGKLDIRSHNPEVLRYYRDNNIGAVIMVAHLGSFEVLRTMGYAHRGVPLKVLMNRAAGAKANAVLDAINPSLVGTVIDTSESDVDRVLKVRSALEKGQMISLMADRYRPGERIAECDFLGDPAPFPLSPWIMAGMLNVPVVLCFGLYRGGNRYDLYFEEFSKNLKLPRARRMQLAQEYAQTYADRLAHYTRDAPYNWFNFYDFWKSAATKHR